MGKFVCRGQQVLKDSNPASSGQFEFDSDVFAVTVVLTPFGFG